MIPRPRKKYKLFLEDDDTPDRKNPPKRRKQYKVYLEDDSEDTPRNTIIRRTSKAQMEDRGGSYFEDESPQCSSVEEVQMEDRGGSYFEDESPQCSSEEENYSSNITEDGMIMTTSFIPDGDKPLYRGAKLTKGESLTVLLGHMLRHHVTKAGCQDLLTLLKMLLPDSSLPYTSYLFNRAFDITSWQMHHYCLNPVCGAYIGVLDVDSVLCSVCNSECKVSEHINKGWYIMYSE
ncbi:uncharacterized protein [Hoplias malabaricus]|uniref:uncharacterized protein n=1 Tax=Hoplias malabaricus TaxID=27720 RepID=UPI0034620E86